jgi:antitoxin (DNA-binding transcriptional repressor) of toxin-antitoxin stability system
MAIPVITVGAFEARTHFSSLLKCVELGEEVLITRHGKAIAGLFRLLPPTGPTCGRPLAE